MNVFGGKDKYLCLYTYIRKENPKLYEVINDLCIDGIFRSQRYKNTFLMPDAKLTEKIYQLVEKDDDDKAVDKIRSLLLKDCLTSKKDFSGEVVNMNSRQLDNPEAVFGDLTKVDKKIVTDYGEVVTVVYAYKGSDVPVSSTENRKRSTPVQRRGGNSSGGGNGSYLDHMTIDKLTKELKEVRPEKLFESFKTGVSKLLMILKQNGKLEEAKYTISAHPVLSWYFLMLPKCGNSLLTNDDLKKYQSIPDSAVDPSAYKEVLEHVQVPSNFFSKVNGMRREVLQEDCTKNRLSSAIESKYKEAFSNKIFPQLILKMFESRIHLKILQDELRFLYEDYCAADMIEEVVAHLDKIHWSKPEEHLILTDQGIYSNMIKPTECFISGPVSFVKSIYFLYAAISDEIEAKLVGSKKGGSDVRGGANPETQNSVGYFGSGARAMTKHHLEQSETFLPKFVHSLSEQQKDTIRKLLN